jgi:AAA15 family ATPase/GTPase
MFKEIHIQNFRGIKDLKINDFKQVNLFVGANNSGKTSVLEALYISLNPNNADLLTVTNLQRGFYNSRIEKGTESIVVEKLFSDGFKYLFYKLLYKKQIEIETLTQTLFLECLRLELQHKKSCLD